MTDADKRFLENVEKLGEITDRSARADGIDPTQLCRDYQAMKPFLNIVLPIIAQIPIWGKRIADALRVLMQIADGLCPAAAK